jgi:hypothetical protein
LIVWTNKTLKTFNSVIRKKMFGNDVPEFIVGDRLIARSPVVRPQPNSTDWTVIADNREEFVVIEDPGGFTDSKYGWEFYSVKAIRDSGEIIDLFILSSESDKLRGEMRSELAKEAKELKEDGNESYRRKWELYHHLGICYDNVTHALALTAHSAQGSTIDNVFLYASEMRRCKEKQQILYTSLTRARSKVFVCQ